MSSDIPSHTLVKLFLKLRTALLIEPLKNLSYIFSSTTFNSETVLGFRRKFQNSFVLCSPDITYPWHWNLENYYVTIVILNDLQTVLVALGYCYCYCYYLRWLMPPFMRQCWGLQVGPMHETAGMGKLINAALLSLMRRVWVYAVLPSSWVNSSALLVCRHDRVTREVGRVGLVGRDQGRRGYWVALYLYIYTARLLMSVFL